MYLSVKENIELTELDIKLIDNLYSLSAESFIDLIQSNVDDFSNIQELISGIVTSFIQFEKYIISLKKQKAYTFKENEIVNLIDYVSTTSFLVDKIVETKNKEFKDIGASERLVS
ncbi:hypothetical protein [Mycoplasma sp. P36-A1]|uniref:hypothetical protein n=1 Tax=Mycoplasma sp. P36-A1 TaxID=3252900 RepID=UPI003C2E8CB3